MERLVKGIWIPIEIWEAEDLSWNEKILLMEVDSFTSKGRDCYISDEYIAGLVGVSERTARNLVSGLIEKGYIAKTRFDGRRRFLESAISYQVGKNCRAERQNLPTTNNNILINNNSLQNYYESIRAREKFNFKESLIALGVDSQVASDWMEVRKAKKAANTQTAFDMLVAEIRKSGKSADECIRICVGQSWKGFKAAWMESLDAPRLPSGGAPARKKSVLEHNQEVAREIMRRTGMMEEKL